MQPMDNSYSVGAVPSLASSAIRKQAIPHWLAGLDGEVGEPAVESAGERPRLPYSSRKVAE
jgi:hypothetical protein